MLTSCRCPAVCHIAHLPSTLPALPALPANLAQVMTKYMPTSVSGYSATGTAHSVASGRISYAFGLSGPAVTADTGGPSWSLYFRWFISLLLA